MSVFVITPSRKLSVGMTSMSGMAARDRFLPPLQARGTVEVASRVALSSSTSANTSSSRPPFVCPSTRAHNPTESFEVGDWTPDRGQRSTFNPQQEFFSDCEFQGQRDRVFRQFHTDLALGYRRRNIQRDLAEIPRPLCGERNVTYALWPTVLWEQCGEFPTAGKVHSVD